MSCHLSKSDITHVCYVSKMTWHNRLGHPSDQVLLVLKDHVDFSDSNSSPCEVCHKAKQVCEPFLLVTIKLHLLVTLSI